MVCWLRLKPRQTKQQRATEVKKAVSVLDRLLTTKKVKAVVGPQGAIAFQGWSEAEREGVSDVCAYRELMVSGSALARAELARAEQLSGRSINRQVINSGTHSHDGGVTWHKGH